VLRAEIRAYRRPRIDVTLGVSHDSDKNNAWWQTVSTSMMLHRGLRGFASAGSYEANDPTLNGTRLSAEAGVVWSSRSVSLSGAIGARRLNSDFGIDRSLGTWRAIASYRVTPSAGLGISYSHYSFDETAFLLANDIDIDELSADGEWHSDLRITRRWKVINEVALSAGYSNSAISSASGAFHYYTAALSARLGL